MLSASDPSSPTDYGARPSWSQQKRPRIPVGKLFGMPQGRALVLLPGEEAPRVSRIKGYFAIRQLARRSDANPFFTGGNFASRRRTVAISCLILFLLLILARL